MRASPRAYVSVAVLLWVPHSIVGTVLYTPPILTIEEHIMNTQALFKAKQDLNQFLREHPELQPLQDRVDRVLNQAGNQQNRIAILSHLLSNSLKDLTEALASASSSIK